MSIQNRLGTHFCGGTVIHSMIVLTAAHCVVRDGKPMEPNLVINNTGKREKVNEIVSTFLDFLPSRFK